jgi:hypothetical protein
MSRRYQAVHVDADRNWRTPIGKPTTGARARAHVAAERANRERGSSDWTEVHDAGRRQRKASGE